MTRDEIVADVQDEVKRGWLEEIEPGVFQATPLGIEAKKLRAAIGVIIQVQNILTRLAPLLTATESRRMTLDEIVSAQLKVQEALEGKRRRQPVRDSFLQGGQYL